MATSTVGQVIVDAMAAHDVDYAFCVPGESYLPVLDALYEHPRVRAVATHHEEGAGFMAHAWSRGTGRTGVAMVTRGPGLSHLAIAIHAARQDSVPLVAITGQVPTSSAGREGFQELDAVGLGNLIGKGGIEITSAERAAEQIGRAVYLAASGRPGPVVVSLPEDVAYETATPGGVHRQPVPVPAPDPGVVASAAALLNGADSVALIVGGGVADDRASTLVVALAERLGAVVYGGWRRFDGFPNTHRQFAGNLPWLPGELSSALTSADVVLAVGTRMGDFTSLGYTVPSDGQPLVQIDLAYESIVATREGDIAIVGDAGETCRRLAALIDIEPDRLARRMDGAHAANSRYVDRTEVAGGTQCDGVVDVGTAITTMRDVLPAEAAITSDAGSFAGYLNRYYRWRRPRTFFGTTAGAMGYAVPAAIGAKLADPDRPVVAVAGDGGFAMTMSEVHTAARLGLGGLVFVAFDNGIYGTIKNHQDRHYPGRSVAIELTSADLAQVGAAMGARGVRVTDDAQFADELKSAIEADTPTVLQVMSSPEQIAVWAD